VRDDYADLADVYDALSGNRGVRSFYGVWRRTLLSAARQRGIRIGVLVDLACGTGNSTLPWTRQRGRTVVGVDRSEAMLREARLKSTTVHWHRQDLRQLRLPYRADAVTCHFDALNHILTAHDLDRVFHNVGALLRKGGLFVFDMNTEHMLRWLKGREKLFRVGEHVFMASNSLAERTGIATFRQLWFVKAGKHYERRDIAVRERSYRDRDIKAMLRRAGMRLVEVIVQVVIEGRPARKIYLA